MVGMLLKWNFCFYNFIVKGTFTSQLYFACNIIFPHKCKRKNGEREEWRDDSRRKIKKNLYTNELSMLYLLHCCGLWARQPIDRHTNRTRALMLSEGRNTFVWTKRQNMLLLQSSHFLIYKLERLPGCVHCSQVFFESLAYPLVVLKIKVKVVGLKLDVYVI